MNKNKLPILFSGFLDYLSKLRGLEFVAALMIVLGQAFRKAPLFLVGVILFAVVLIYCAVKPYVTLKKYSSEISDEEIERMVNGARSDNPYENALIYRKVIAKLKGDKTEIKPYQSQTPYKQSKLIMVIMTLFGVIFICGGVYFVVDGIKTYNEEVSQKDWIVATATVTDVSEEIKSHSGSGRGYYTVYDIVYCYVVDDIEYQNEISETKTPKDMYETFMVKYNPDNPSESTEILEPQAGSVIGGFGGGFVFALVGIFVIYNAFGKKKHPDDYVPEEDRIDSY